MAMDPQVLYEGGPLDPYLAFGVALVPSGRPEPPGYTALSGRLGLLDLGADPTPARCSGVRLRIFVGYYGWGPGQLESELASGRLVEIGWATEQGFEYGKQPAR
jgi:putative transcriptional regulator